MPFNEKYINIKKLAQAEINFIEKYMVQCINVREPLNSHIISFITAPSKRVRPLLSILFFKSLYNDINQEQLKALSAVEIIHSASLIHDDIIDQSVIRRGLTTIAHEFGNKLGVISGDYLLSIAMKILTEIGVMELLSKISFTMNSMCVGEINQNFDRFKIGTIEEYIEKSKNKTAYLFETGMLSPFLINKIENEHASSFGINTGIAFQIRDDLLNLIKSDMLKPVQNDISNGIYNAPVIYAGSSENYHNGVEKTKDLLNNYINKAYLDIKILPDNEYKAGLEQFLELLKFD